MSSTIAVGFFKGCEASPSRSQEGSRHLQRSTSHHESLNRDLECLVEGICKKRISLAVEERDDMWRRHEKAQIAFLQKENAQMLTGLHTEIERLHNELREAYRQLYVEKRESHTEQLEKENELLRQRIIETERSNEELAKKLDESTSNALLVEQQLTNVINIFKNQLAYQGNKIRQLTEEVRERSTTVAQLVNQLRFGSNDDSICGGGGLRCRLHPRPVAHWDSMFVPHSTNRCAQMTNVDSRCALVRSVSVTYPGGRPNVVTHKCIQSPSTRRSQHLPRLCTRWQSFSGSGCSIEKPPRKFNCTPLERMPLTRSLYESGDKNTAHISVNEESKSTK
uniref:CCDC92/74 N-terminal domain-containing protein n=1 Tax=Parascaris univalens TaxID=6257 RepID=A0A915BLG8_PARUN